MVGFFALLPSEVVSLILDNVTSRKDLYHCTLVNKWFYANTVARLWRAPLLKGISGPRQMFEGFLSAQQHRYLMLGDHMRALYMDYHPMADVTIESLVVYTPFLERLELFSSFGLVIPAPLGLVWRSCPRLVEVCLDDVLLDNLTSLARNCPHIRRLEFRRFSGVNDNIFQPLLTLNNLTILVFVDFKWINSGLISSIICQLHQLEHLEIVNNRLTSRAFFDKLLPTPTHPKTLSNLKKLRLGGDVNNFYAKEVILFLATHPLLEIIHVHLVGIDNLFFSSVAGHPNLSTMRLLSGPGYGLESEYVRSMVIACPRLTTLWLPRDCGLPARCFPEANHLYVNGFFCLDSLTIASIRQNPDLHFID
ncbi:hypothetical protein [Absidia glauca]|uniref:F-box domain-containing protein n=1 Tax=Absidia glauca TaxID=4829 RepID=A0A163KRF0_ABSGL|nr:hypothetical protein [Absidia glauca]